MSRSKQTESQAARAEEVVNTIIQAAYTAPMDADTVRRMLDQDILSNRVRRTHPGHGVVTETLRRALPETPTRRDEVSQHHKPHVPGVITFANGAPVRAKTAGQVGLRQRHRIAYRHLRHRSGRQRQDVSGRGQGRARIPGPQGAPHHPDPSGRGGGGEPRLPARHAQREGGPVPAARSTTPSPTCSAPTSCVITWTTATLR